MGTHYFILGYFSATQQLPWDTEFIKWMQFCVGPTRRRESRC